jgi:hypothetical protein
MGRSCSTHGEEEEENAYRILVGKLVGKRTLGRGRIILEWIIEKYDGVVWTGLM